MKKLLAFKQKVDSLLPDKELNEEEAKIIASILLSNDSKFDVEITSKDPDIANVSGFQIFLKRLEGLTDLKITRGALICIGIHFENPGQAVMYAYYLNRKCEPNTTVTVDTITKKLFPWGMISNKQHEELWDAQKLVGDEIEQAEVLERYGAYDNLLDYKLTWEK